ncbi:Uncharacterised protein [uncultured archaeon]|nr:Uncharacterised protein [uncultured archaeon]
MRDLLLFAALLLASWWLYASGALESFVLGLGNFMNLGVLVSGFFYSTTITSPLALAMFATYAKTMSPLRIAMAAGVGAMFADVMIFMGFGKITERDFIIAGRKVRIPKPAGALEKTLLTALGLVLVALPFPNEPAVALMGVGGMKMNRFMALSLASKFVGIFLIAWALASI